MSLGEYSLVFKKFAVNFKEFETKPFALLHKKVKTDLLCSKLLSFIEKENSPCFLLPAICNFLGEIERRGIMEEFPFSSFELWLNHYSKLSQDKNRMIREKIVGKFLPREAYQVLFPIGTGKVYGGSHFVTAHRSPDLDTMIGSFWGWVDAFGARVSEGVHYWNLPKPAPSQIEVKILFEEVFGKRALDILSKDLSKLAIFSIDLMTQEGVVAIKPTKKITEVDLERDTAVILVDEKGYFLGDWRSLDADNVKKISLLMNHCLRFVENAIQYKCLILFGKKTLKKEELKSLFRFFLNLSFAEMDPVREFREKDRVLFDRFLKEVLRLKGGIKESFSSLFGKKIKIDFSSLFYRGALKDDRVEIFGFLQKLTKKLEEEFKRIREKIDRTGVALEIKHFLFDTLSKKVSPSADVEELMNKMGSSPYLSVTLFDKGKEMPLGIVKSSSLHSRILGTVSLRDFCNDEEMKFSRFLEIISVIDHHRADLRTFSPPIAILGDVQSSNTLVAEKAFYLQDSHPQAVHRDRAFLEYLHFLYAILDDTDLLMKVTKRDLLCVAELINRMNALRKEKRAIEIDGLSLEAAQKKLLQNKDLFSLYEKVFSFREREMEKKLFSKRSEEVFYDTKVLGGCSRVGQLKLFYKNLSSFKKRRERLMKNFLNLAKRFYKEEPLIDLHMQMVTTIRDAKEVYSGKYRRYKHSDELWLWLPNTELAKNHLESFLREFSSAKSFEISFGGEFEEFFLQSGFSAKKRKPHKIPLIILTYPAGTINSRKAMIFPYLPKL